MCVIHMLNDTHQSLREISERMCFAMFDLLRSFSAQANDKSELQQRIRTGEILTRSSILKEVIFLLKKEIPAEHRMQSDEHSFDMSGEQRRINACLRTLCGDQSHNIYSFPFENLEEDIRPFVMDTIKFALM